MRENSVTRRPLR